MKHDAKLMTTADLSPSCSVDISLDRLKDLGLEIHLGLTHLSINLEPVGCDEYDALIDAVPENMCEDDQDELIAAIGDVYDRIILKRLFSKASRIQNRRVKIANG